MLSSLQDAVDEGFVKSRRPYGGGVAAFSSNSVFGIGARVCVVIVAGVSEGGG